MAAQVESPASLDARTRDRDQPQVHDHGRRSHRAEGEPRPNAGAAASPAEEQQQQQGHAEAGDADIPVLEDRHAFDLEGPEEGPEHVDRERCCHNEAWANRARPFLAIGPQTQEPHEPIRPQQQEGPGYDRALGGPAQSIEERPEHEEKRSDLARRPRAGSRTPVGWVSDPSCDLAEQRVLGVVEGKR